MDFSLKCGHTMICVGSSGAGKTPFTAKLMQNRKHVFNVPLKKVWWLYAESNDSTTTEKALKDIKNIEFIRGLQEGWHDLPQTHDVLVVDDLMSEANKQKDLTNLFTRTARHRQNHPYAQTFEIFI